MPAATFKSMGTGYGFANKINDIFAKNNLRLSKILRFGPRFFIALCQKKKLKCVLKINLYERNINQDTKTHNEHLAREAFFLKCVQQQKNFSFLKKSVPKIYDSDLTGQQTWYLKDYALGNLQNLSRSNFLFKNSFFTQENLNWVIKFFSELHCFSQNLPLRMQKFFHYHSLADYLILINDQGVKNILGKKVNQILLFLKKQGKIFNQNQSALTHFEPYPVHFIRSKNNMKIIDWENVGWGNGAHDVAIIWLRAWQHQQWQKNLRKNFPLKTPLKNHWEELFKIEIIIQSVANLPYLEGTTDTDEKKIAKEAIYFFQKQIALILANKF